MIKKKIKKNKKYNVNQSSFYFEDYLETNLKRKNISKSSIYEDRIYLLFFFFLCLITIFSIKISIISFQEPQFLETKKNNLNFLPLRRDIVDRNGELISRNIKAFHAKVRPNLINDKKKFLLKIKLNFPEISQERIKNKLEAGQWFYLKKRLTKDEKDKLWEMGERGLEFESYQSRIYPQANLYSHILGQIDNDNYGISGVEKYFDRSLKNIQNINKPMKLSLDTNIQYLIKTELIKALDDFKAKGAAGLLMDNTSGEVLSLVSLPDYNINIRNNISDKSYTNKITKGLYELGSVFKTFTVALALDEEILEPDSIITNISNKFKCSIHEIKDIHEFPTSMSVEDILIQSSNIGALKIARKIGKEKYKFFLEELNLLNTPNLEIDEVSTPSKLDWKNKCKLETVSFGHGIMTTPLHVAAAYSAITNGGYIVKPTLLKKPYNQADRKQVISKATSLKINKILRKVVTDEKGTASMANIFGYQVGGKTGTAQNYQRKKENINTFISVFPILDPKYVLLVMLDDPKPAPHIVYNYRGRSIKVNRNEAGWNSVYVSGKIIEKIGPILAINNNEVYSNHVVKKNN
jgi:cell division protein FtsI (penicillin-binding protein 3)